MPGKLNFNTTQPLGGCLIGVITHHSKATVQTLHYYKCQTTTPDYMLRYVVKENHV